MNIKNLINLFKAREVVVARAEATLMSTATYVAEQARGYAPVDTGELRSSITVLSSMAGARVSVVASAPHAQWVEFGHYSVAGLFVPPDPFMRRARDDGIRMFSAFAAASRVVRPDDARGLSHLGVEFQGH